MVPDLHHIDLGAWIWGNRVPSSNLNNHKCTAETIMISAVVVEEDQAEEGVEAAYSAAL